MNQPEEEEDGSPVTHTINVVIVIQKGFDSINEAGVKLLSLIKDKQSLRAAQHHVTDGFFQLALKHTKLFPLTTGILFLFNSHLLPSSGR